MNAERQHQTKLQEGRKLVRDIATELRKAVKKTYSFGAVSVQRTSICSHIGEAFLIKGRKNFLDSIEYDLARIEIATGFGVPEWYVEIQELNSSTGQTIARVISKNKYSGLEYVKLIDGEATIRLNARR